MYWFVRLNLSEKWYDLQLVISYIYILYIILNMIVCSGCGGSVIKSQHKVPSLGPNRRHRLYLSAHVVSNYRIPLRTVRPWQFKNMTKHDVTKYVAARPVGGKYSGGLEVCYKDTWVTICNHSWGFQDNNIACKVMGRGFPPRSSNTRPQSQTLVEV